MSKSYLIDTHILIWYLDGNTNLPEKIKVELNDPVNKIFVSIASLWELTIKLAKEKIDIDITLSKIEEDILKRDFEILPISFKHLNTLLFLSFPHGDPFDRMLIAQAVSENLTVISVDRFFAAYPINLFK